MTNRLREMVENVWEETWSVVGGDVESDSDTGGCVFKQSYTGRDPEEGREERRFRLAATAPEMARVLLAVEWDGGMCPSCGGTRDRHEDDGHAIDCALDAVLRKSGVR